MVMTRLLRIVLVALLVGPLAAEVLMPSAVSCEETSDCCAPDGACDESCVLCPCCTIPAPTVMSCLSVEPVDAPAGHVGTQSGAAALPLLPAEIQHVPKSL